MAAWPENKSNEEVYQRRDFILAEIHADVKYLRERVEQQKIDLQEHEKKDEKVQGWIMKIGVMVLIIVAANGGMEALKVLFKIGG